MNTIRGILTAIIRQMKYNDIVNKFTVNDNALKKYIELSKILNKQYIEQEQENTKTERQSENWAKWSEILNVRTVVHEIYKQSETLQNYQNYLILCLYTMHYPLRLNYGDIYIVNNVEDNKINNILVFDSRPYFLFRQYKTSKFYGDIQIYITGELLGVLKYWFCNHNTDKKYLLVRDDKNILGDKQLYNHIVSIFMKHTGKKISANMLRHSYITDHMDKLSSMSVRERKYIARLMCHNKNTQELYYKKE
jgi:hypothetical protein